MSAVVGVDVCNDGWAAASLVSAQAPSLAEHKSLEASLTAFPDAAFVAVDIPLTFSTDGKPRPADMAARKYLGERWIIRVSCAPRCSSGSA